MALTGPSGSGKTFTSLSIGTELGNKILVVDTESGSASKYGDMFNFDVIELSEFAPENFIEAIRLGEANGYDVVIIDSLSHEWNGRGGILEIHEAETKRGGNSYTAWAKVTPRHNALIQAVIQSKLHVISTMRAKTDYSIEKDDKGRTQVKTVGLAPVQRDGMEYEYDVVASIDIENNFIVQKTRCPMLSGKVFPKAGIQVAEILKVWLQGVPVTTVKMPAPANLEIVKAQNQPEPATADYSSQWNAALNNPVPFKIDANVSPQTKGKLLLEAGHVSRTAKGYAVSESIENQTVVFDVTRTDAGIVCTCSNFADGISDRADYNCAHIEAVRLFAAASAQKQAA